MPHIDAVHATCAIHWPMMNRKDHAITLAQRNYLYPRLHPWTLFRQHELSTTEIAFRFR